MGLLPLLLWPNPRPTHGTDTTVMDTIPVSMAMVTNKPGPQPLAPDSPAPASAVAERGQLRLSPDMDSMVTILMVTMASTVPTMVFIWELVWLVTPVPLLLIPTEVSKVLARGLLKKRLS